MGGMFVLSLDWLGVKDGINIKSVRFPGPRLLSTDSLFSTNEHCQTLNSTALHNITSPTKASSHTFSCHDGFVGLVDYMNTHSHRRLLYTDVYYKYEKS